MCKFAAVMDKISKKKQEILGDILRAERNYRCIEQKELARKLNKKQAFITEITSIPAAPAIAGAYYARDGVLRTKLPLENTYYDKKKR